QPDKNRRDRENQPEARPVGQADHERGEPGTDPREHRGRHPDDETGLLQALQDIRTHTLTDSNQAEDARGEKEPAAGEHQRRAQAPDRTHALCQRLDQIGGRDPLYAPPLARVFRKLLSALWVATFSDAMLIPLIAAASFNDLSS